MTTHALQLYPPAEPNERQVVLDGLYLEHALHRRGEPGKPYIYGNFVTSLDGRIAMRTDEGQAYTPPSLTTDGDWALFRELQAQADCLVTHGGYLRALARGELDDICRSAPSRGTLMRSGAGTTVWNRNRLFLR